MLSICIEQKLVSVQGSPQSAQECHLSTMARCLSSKIKQLLFPFPLSFFPPSWRCHRTVAAGRFGALDLVWVALACRATSKAFTSFATPCTWSPEWECSAKAPARLAGEGILIALQSCLSLQSPRCDDKDANFVPGEWIWAMLVFAIHCCF